MEGESITANNDPELEATKAKQGKVTGIIIPPPEIRAVTDKTAQFVARNGKSFETKILSSEEGKTAKFNFMKPFDPYHAYYEFKIREFEEAIANGGIKPATAAAPVAAIPPPIISSAATTASASAVTTTVKATLMSPIAKFAMAKAPSSSQVEVTSASSYEFSLGTPLGVSMLDQDIIKLTAQYTAANGRDFLAGIAQREQRNPQFDFLKPTHLLFSYFTSLVDNYSKILHPTKQLKERLEVTNNKMMALEKLIHQWKFDRKEQEKRLRDDQNATEEKLAFQNIDWHDFVVVETINFPLDELYDYPVVNLLSSNMKGQMDGQQQTARLPQSTAPSAVLLPPPPISHAPNSTVHTRRSTALDSSEDMDMDDDSHAYQPTRSSAAAAVSFPFKATNNYVDDDMVDDDDDMQIKVVSDFRPRMAPAANFTSASSASGTSSVAHTMIDPISGKAVPVHEMAEHMRVSLLDPKWRTEQQRFQEKQRDTGYAEGSSIADSLRQFAKKRGDIFSSASALITEGSDGNDDTEETESERIQWDGHQNSIALAQQRQREMAMRAPVAPAAAKPSAAGAAVVAGPSLPAAPLAVTHAAAFAIPPSPSSLLMSMRPPTLPVPPVEPVIPMGLPPMMPPMIPLAPFGLPLPHIALPVTVLPPVASGMPAPLAVPIPLAPAAARQVPTTVVAQGAAKKARADNELIPEDEFVQSRPGTLNITVSCPGDATASTATQNWGLQGQSLPIALESVSMSVKALKELIVQKLKESGSGTADAIPLNKFQLKIINCGWKGQNGPNYGMFLKDSGSIAAHNVDEGYVLELVVKSRR